MSAPEIVVGACYRGRADAVVRVIGLDAADGLVTFVPLDSTLARVGLAPSGLESVCSLAMFAHLYSVRVPDPTPAVVEDLTVRELGERLRALGARVDECTFTFDDGQWYVGAIAANGDRRGATGPNLQDAFAALLARLDGGQ